jgi:hypothetical protein
VYYSVLSVATELCLVSRWLVMDISVCLLKRERVLQNRCVAMVIFVTICYRIWQWHASRELSVWGHVSCNIIRHGGLVAEFLIMERIDSLPFLEFLSDSLLSYCHYLWFWIQCKLHSHVSYPLYTLHKTETSLRSDCISCLLQTHTTSPFQCLRTNWTRLPYRPNI